MSGQPDLFGVADGGLPPGLRYEPALIDAAEAERLTQLIAPLPFREFEFHGFTGKRRVVSFGWKYDFAAARLVETHLLLIVVLRDEELESIVDRTPETADDVTRAVTAAGLLKDRLLALTRLRHLGAHVIESEYDRVADRLVEGYVDLKRRNLL